MAIYNIGLLIKDLRLQHGLTQAELAEGICSRDTVVKVENGKRKPDYFVCQHILMRLGANNLLNTYVDTILDESDSEILEAFVQAQNLLNEKKYDELRELTNQLESNKKFDSNIARSVVLSCKFGLYTQPGLPLAKYQEGIEFCFELLKITRPNFDISKVGSYYLAPKEFIRLSNLGNIYAHMGEHGKSADLFQTLISIYDNKYRVKIGLEYWHTALFNNYAFALAKAERNEEALEVAEKGIQMYLESNNLRQFYQSLYLKATCLCRLKRMDEGKEAFTKLCYILIATGGDASVNFENIAEDFKNDFGLVFNAEAQPIK